MISYYELLKMIKEDKAPKKVRIHLTPNTSKIYIRKDDIEDTFSYYGLLNEDEETEEYKYYLSECLLESSMFDKNIEILEEEKKIPEKIKDKYCSQISKVELAQKYNEIIDYLKSKGE